MTDPSEACENIFIGDLPIEYDEEQLKQIFGVYGAIASSKLLPGSGKNAMLLRFENIVDAVWVKENLNGNIPQGLTTPVYVNFNNRAAKGKGKGKGDDGFGKSGFGKDGFGKDGFGKDGFGKDGFGKDGGGKGKDWGGPYSDGGKGDWQGEFASLMQMCWSMKGKKGGGKGGIRSIKEYLIEQGVLPGGKWNNDQNAVYVHGLPRDTSDVDLYHIFTGFGAIPALGCRAMLSDDGFCKGFGFVNYIDPAAAQMAIMSLHGTQLADGKSLTVQLKQKKEAPKGQVVAPPGITLAQALGSEQSAPAGMIEGFAEGGLPAGMF